MTPSPPRPARRLLVLLALGALSGAASPAHAQDERRWPGDLEAAMAPARPGELLRVRLRRGDALEGEFAGFRDGALLLAGARDTAALLPDEVSAAWLRRRQTRRGATVGGLLGGGIGLAFGALFAALPVEGGHADDEDLSIVLSSTALGAGTGAALGGIVGAAGRKWRQLFPTDSGIRPAFPRLPRQVGEGGAVPAAGPGDPVAPAAATAGPGPSQRRFGALEGALAYGRLNGAYDSDGGPGARVALLAEFRRGREGGTRALLAVGPELELQSVGTSPVGDGTGQTVAFTAAAVRVVGRIGPETDRVRAYALGGAGIHAWRTEERYASGDPVELFDTWWTHPSGVAGVGVQYRPGTRALAVGVEARQNFIVLSGDEYPARYWSVAATVNTSL